MRVIDLAFKDLLQIVRDWKSGLFLLIMPVLFTLFFGFVMGSALNPGQGEDLRLPVGVLNQDGGRLASDLEGMLSDSEVIRPVPLDDEPEEINGMVDSGDLTAALIIPAGYSDQLLADQPIALDVIVDITQPAGQTAFNALETISARLMASVEAAHISLHAGQDQNLVPDAASSQNYLQDSLSAALTAWETPPLTVTVVKATGNNQQNSAIDPINGFVQSSPGMMVQFAIFGLITSAMVMVLERKSGTLQRLLSTPIRHSEVIAGHTLAMFLIVFAQQVILVLLGQALFKVDYFREPLAVLLLVTVLSSWAASLGLLISVLAKKEDQVITLSMIAMSVFAALGGAWFPLEVAGKTFSSIGHLLPTAWAMDGFQNIIMRGLEFQSVLLPAAILFGYTLVFFGLAVWRFRFE